MCAQLLNCICPFATLWTVASQAPLSMGCSRLRILLPFPTPGNLSNPGIKPASLESPALADRFLTNVPPGEPPTSVHLMYRRCLQQRRQENLRDQGLGSELCLPVLGSCCTSKKGICPGHKWASEQDMGPRVTRTPCLPSKVRPGAFSTA